MTRSGRMEPIADLARDRESRAALQLGKSRQALQVQERQLEELIQFQREYQERFQVLGQGGINIQRLNEYRRFNDRLNEAIRQQRGVLEEYRRRLEHENRNWSEASTRRQALEKTMDRFRSEEAIHAGRIEQRDADEYAQNTRSVLDRHGLG